MGLDISLIRILKEPISELDWLAAEDCSELKRRYINFLTERIIHFENELEFKESGYYYEEISYQRKGVKKSFYDRYKPDVFIFTVEDLNELKKYILDDYMDRFETDFINKFKENETVILIGY